MELPGLEPKVWPSQEIDERKSVVCVASREMTEPKLFNETILRQVQWKKVSTCWVEKGQKEMEKSVYTLSL